MHARRGDSFDFCFSRWVTEFCGLSSTGARLDECDVSGAGYAGSVQALEHHYCMLDELALNNVCPVNVVIQQQVLLISFFRCIYVYVCISQENILCELTF